MKDELKILDKNNINQIRKKLGLSPKKYLYTRIKNELRIYKSNVILSSKILA